LDIVARRSDGAAGVGVTDFSHFGKDNVNHEFTAAKYEEMGAALVNSLYEYVMIVEEDERRK
jgi:hypothetical protein